MNDQPQYPLSDDPRAHDPSPDEKAFLASLAAAKSGSAEELGRVLASCQSYLRLIAGHAMGDDLREKVSSSDIVQETFIEAHSHFDQFRGTTRAELLGWLGQLLQNRTVELARRLVQTEKRNPNREVPLVDEEGTSEGGIDLPAIGPGPSTVAEVNDELNRLREALPRLPDEYRQVIQLRSFDRRSWGEIGDIMERTSDAVRKLFARAVERLADELEIPRGESPPPNP